MPMSELDRLRAVINQAYLQDEQTAVETLAATLETFDFTATGRLAKSWVEAVRREQKKTAVTDALLHEYRLDSQEGIVLMAIAEALLRIPDAATQDRLLTDKLTTTRWHEHIRHSRSWLVNFSSGALQLTSDFEKLVKADQLEHQAIIEKLLARLGMPVVRAALKQAMHLLATRFVIAETIEQAVAKSTRRRDYRYSFDMLGEAALTASDAERYMQAYAHAITQLAVVATDSDDTLNNPGISVKLSALCPRYEPSQHRRAEAELTEKLLVLAEQASTGRISMTIDAEESDRLELSLAVFESVYRRCPWPDGSGLGIAVQAYQKRAPAVIDWLGALAENTGRKIPVRLVKGAYWDTEIKRAQENGLRHYPVFTRKSATDISYLACAKTLLYHSDRFFPQFATHNAHTIAAILLAAPAGSRYEFQRLYGMGEQLYEHTLATPAWNTHCRIYAPVGTYQDLLPYLVRRLLENGANTSFVQQIENPGIPVTEIVNDPLASWQELETSKKSSVPLPLNLYGQQRKNAYGDNLSDLTTLSELQQTLYQLRTVQPLSHAVIDGVNADGCATEVYSPQDRSRLVGRIVYADAEATAATLNAAERSFGDWRLTPASTRAGYLNRAAELLEEHRVHLASLCVREGGRTLRDALSEVREAVDFCRYYAASAIRLFDQPQPLPGPTGEDNHLCYYGRGVFVCISPWNFPIAIFTGQVAAALVAGNTVIAKPAEATSLTAAACYQLLLEAGIPASVFHFLPGPGAILGARLLTDERVAGVAFTGSLATARHINLQLAAHRQIVPLIAETGGQNVMIADTSAHMEQLVQDAIQSAFNSAGQRCSALRVLFVPVETADRIVDMLVGAMQQLILGDPGEYTTDIGPVIDENAASKLADHIRRLSPHARMVFQLPLPGELNAGVFFPPSLIEIDSLTRLQEEVFGPVLHVIRYRADELERVVRDVHATGYGLTLGIHSRIEKTVRHLQTQLQVGNIYVNRNMIGAVVGVQPFGGMGLSGTGPKAGGPDYLRRFAVEQTVTVNTAAIGGNSALLAQNLR